jgi:DNA-3-methyladenine glycosylase II
MKLKSKSAACAYLASVDPVMARLVDMFGPLSLGSRDAKTSFGVLSRMIMGQQLSGKAAATIFGRYVELIPGRDHHAHKHVLQLTPEQLRGVGLSGSKARFIMELAKAASEKRLPEIKALKKMNEVEVRSALMEFYGVGNWTVDMFLIFVLKNENVLSLADAGLRRGFELAYPKSRKKFEQYREVWSPHCSTACRYLWQIADNPRVLEKLGRKSRSE